MKTMRVGLVLASVLFLAATGSGQVFNSGSSGALGDVVISSDTVWDIPNNGQFHVNSLVVEANVYLGFRKPTNGLNPPVYILARSNVTIYCCGGIYVDAQPAGPSLTASEGGPGGFNGGGAGTPPASSAGAGHGPGRGGPGLGASYGTYPGNSGVPIYGNLLLMPLVGGSGGGGYDGNPGYSGGGGGGAILIASDTGISLYGYLYARGGDSQISRSGAGSGGAVRLVAPVIEGNGTINVGAGAYNGGWGFDKAGEGRARIDCLPQPISIPVVGRYETPPWRVGRNPAIFPPSGPRLEVIHAAGKDIPPGTNSSVSVTLPVGSSSSQVVTLRAVNFSGSFDVRVDATPESGASSRTSFTWNVGANTTATTNVTVQIPGNNPTRITAWAEVLF